VKLSEFLARDGVVVPERTVRRFIATDFGPRRGQGSTVRVADGEPGHELQIDFGRLGLLTDPVTGKRRVCHALIFTAVFSRHMFVWLSFTQTTDAVIAGCEAAWRFLGGVFKVLMPGRDMWRAAARPLVSWGAHRPAGHITLSLGRSTVWGFQFVLKEEVAHVGTALREAVDGRPVACVVDRGRDRGVNRLAHRARLWPQVGVAPSPDRVRVRRARPSEGASSVADLQRFVEGFVAARIAAHPRRNCSGRLMAKEVRRPIERCCRAFIAGFVPSGRSTGSFTFTDQVPGFVDYLIDERGLRPASVDQYRHHLARFDVYSRRIDATVADLFPALVSAFMVERASVGLARSTVRNWPGCCGCSSGSRTVPGSSAAI